MLIVLDGIDSSGKATQSRILAERMRGEVVSFPAYDTPVGQAILGNLKGEWRAADYDSGPSMFGQGMHMQANGYQRNDGLNALVLQCLMTVNRLELLPVIAALRAAGKPVVLDRYWSSALVYGAADGLDPKWLETIHASMPEPDAWLLVDVDPAEAVRRRPDRRDRYEADGMMSHRRELYRNLWQSRVADKRWQVVDGGGTVDEVTARVRDALASAGVIT